MLVSELKDNQGSNLIAESKLWNRDVSTLRPLDISAFLRSHWGSGTYNEAMRQVDKLIDACWIATLNKEIDKAPDLVFYDPMPRQRITLDELCLWLGETSPARRRAVLFGLETGMPIQEIIALTWKDLFKMKGVSQFALELAARTPRHFKLDYVFWEPMVNNAAAPLFGLADAVIAVSQGMGYEALQRLYKEIIPIDTKADMEAFMTEFCENHDECISK